MASDLGAQLSEMNDLLKVQRSCFSLCLTWVLLSVVKSQLLRELREMKVSSTDLRHSCMKDTPCSPRKAKEV